MSAADRIAALEAAVADLTEQLRPQRLRGTLEKTADPRGYADWTRIVDSTGKPFGPPRRQLQFPGATVADDPVSGATVVNTGGGGGGLTTNYSNDSTLTSAERIRFMSEDEPTVVKGAIDTNTVTLGSQSGKSTLSIRTASGALAASGGNVDDPTTLYPVRLDMSNQSSGLPFGAGVGSINLLVGKGTSDDPTYSGSMSFKAYGATGTMIDTLAQCRSVGSGLDTFARLRAESWLTSGQQQGAALTVVCPISNGQAQVRTTTMRGLMRVVASDDNTSNFMQAEASAVNAAAVRRVMRGPFSAAATALAAGASVTVTVADCRRGTDYAVSGGLKGAAGCEELCWSYADNGTTGIDITFKNPTAGALTATLQFFVIATS